MVLLSTFGCNRIFDPGPPVVPLNATVAVPVSWQGETNNLAAVASMAQGWWKIFENPELTRLVEQALESEPNIHLARARVEEFHAKTQVARTRIFPRVEFVPQFQKEKISETDTPFGLSPTLIKDESFTRYQLPFQVSYSLDLFGRLAPKGRALENNKSAARADLQAAALLISGEVARGYFVFQSLHTETILLQQSLTKWSDEIGLQQSLFNAGQKNEQSLALAKLASAQVEAELAKARGDLKLASNGLARLVGVAPAEFEKPAVLVVKPPPRIPAGIPADILCTRPDIVAARCRLTAGLNEAEAERLSTFPVLELTAAGGFASADLLKLIQTNSLAWSVGASLAKTVFDAGESRYRRKVVYAKYKQLAANYDKVLLDALKEVEDALSRIYSLRERIAAMAKAELAAKDLTQIARSQYNDGLISYLEVIAAERSLLAVRRTQNQLNASLNDATIQLIVALGCGC